MTDGIATRRSTYSADSSSWEHSAEDQFINECYSATADTIPRLEKWLHQGVNVNAVRKDGVTALTAAIRPDGAFRDRLLEFLLEKRADPNLTGPGESEVRNPLRRAVTVEAGVSVLQLLLEAKADATEVGSDDLTVLHHLTKKAVGTFPYTSSVENQVLRVARVLLDGGARPSLLTLSSRALPKGLLHSQVHSVFAWCRLGFPRTLGLYDLFAEHLSIYRRELRTCLRGPLGLGFGLGLDEHEHAHVVATVVDYVCPVSGDNDEFVLASGRNELTAVAAMLRSGVSVNATSQDGETALFRACVENFVEMIDLLLAAGANPNAHTWCDETPLHALLIGKSSTDTVRKLVSAGADVHAATRLGVTPLALACMHTELSNLFCKHLLEGGAAPAMLTPFAPDWVTPLEHSAANGRAQHALFLEHLIRYRSGLTVELVHSGVLLIRPLATLVVDYVCPPTPVLNMDQVGVACMFGYAALLRAGMSQRFDADRIDVNHLFRRSTLGLDRTLLRTAVRSNHTGIVEILLEHKADVNLGTPLLNPDSDLDLVTLNLMLRAGVDVTSVNGRGHTVLHALVGRYMFEGDGDERRRIQCAELCLSNGARACLSQRSKMNDTPIDKCRRRGYRELGRFYAEQLSLFRKELCHSLNRLGLVSAPDVNLIVEYVCIDEGPPEAEIKRPLKVSPKPHRESALNKGVVLLLFVLMLVAAKWVLVIAWALNDLAASSPMLIPQAAAT